MVPTKHGQSRAAKPSERKLSPAPRRRRASRRRIAPGAFPVAGIGASAGGLDAFKKFFSAMPTDSGAAFVLIQHLDPTRESLTTALVGGYTPMPVVQAEEGMRLEPNRVYVIPPNTYLTIRHRTLRLSPPTAPRSMRMAVDFFLRSLAEDQQENAIGVVLSGTGTDGTLGLNEIKAAGGMTMVQDPATAQHDGMPRSAIAGGSADYVLPAEQMAETLLAYLRHATVAASRGALPPDKEPDSLTNALEVLRARSKFDFSGYKTGTLRRRIQRRMGLRHCGEMSAYIDLLARDSGEVAALFRDLLINVTSFFREPAAWRVLQERVIRPLVVGKSADAPLRAWVPACATGEEAYSIAMLLIEEIEAADKRCHPQVFASDVDSEALEVGRSGVYPQGIAAHVSARRLSRFFTEVEHGYQVSKELRDAVVFAQQSLVSDPPFSKLDLVSCRNLFIYLEPALQDRLIPLLHFALLEGGYLFLGSAEGIGLRDDLFEAVSTKWRIYRRIGPTRRDTLQFPLAPAAAVRRGRAAGVPSPPRLATLAQQLLLQRYAPACVIINRAGEILYFHGHTDDYLEQPEGLPTQNLIARARSGLRSPLRRTLQEAMRENRRAVTSGVQVRRGGVLEPVKIAVEPFGDSSREVEGLWLISLEDEPPTPAPAAARAGVAASVAEAPAADATVVHDLEYELKTTREDLQQSIEDIRAANEELMSVNEEMQASNEELETSQEELQSLNEELTTANSELESKIVELEATNNDLDNLLNSTNIATLFLDTRLCIRRFTPAATKLFSLIAADIGRPMVDIAPKFNDQALLSDMAAALAQPVAPTAEVKAADGRWYIRQVLPYRTRDERTEGLVITFSDVAAEALEKARLYAESIVDTVRESLLVLDQDLRVQSANQSFYATFGLSPEQVVGHPFYELGKGELDVPELREPLVDLLAHGHMLSEIELKLELESIGSRVMQVNARTIGRDGHPPLLALLAIEDITERKQALEAVRESEARKQQEDAMRQRQAELAHALRIITVGELASGLAHELNQPLSAIANGVEACARLVRLGNVGPNKLLGLLEEASSEALRAAEIVEHLRGFIQRGEPQLEQTDLREIVRGVPLLLRHELEQAQITLNQVLGEQDVPIHADRIQIEQVVVNLLQNAIESMRDGDVARREIHLEIRVERRIVTVIVRDTGPGVSVPPKDDIFEPFFTTKPQGLGMGLAISRSIIEAHGGKIWAERPADGGPGSALCFTLPVWGGRHRRKGSE